MPKLRYQISSAESGNLCIIIIIIIIIGVWQVTEYFWCNKGEVVVIYINRLKPIDLHTNRQV